MTTKSDGDVAAKARLAQEFSISPGSVTNYMERAKLRRKAR